jgi:hypothetical protein
VAEGREEPDEQPADVGVRAVYPAGDTGRSEGSEQVSWWQRMFGG